MNPDFQRLHPLTIVIEAWRAVSRFLILILFFGFQAMTSRGPIDTSELIFGGVGLLVIGSALVRYFTFKFAIHNGSLLVKQGLITKKDRTIPLARIQNINLKRDLIHRIVGLVDLEIETAGGGKAEATLSAVTEDQAHELKQKLLGRYDPLSSPLIEARREEVIYQATARELFIAGATENRLLIMVASIFGIVSAAPGFMEAFTTWIEKAIKGAVQQAGRSPSDWTVWIVLGLIALIVGWLASIIMTFISYWGFEVAWKDGAFRRQYGLLNHFENVVPAKRIQTARFTANFIQKWFGVGKLYLDTAGSFSQQSDGEGRQSARPTPLMAPLINWEGAMKILGRVFADLELEEARWTPPPSRMIGRWAFSAWPTALLAGAACAYFFKFWGIGAFVGIFLLTALYAWWTRPLMGWQDDGVRLLVRRGRLWRSLQIAPIQKIQMAEVNQSPAQKRFGLASVRVCTAGSAADSSLVIMDIPAEEARSLAWDLHRRSGLNAWQNPDGF